MNWAGKSRITLRYQRRRHLRNGRRAAVYQTIRAMDAVRLLAVGIRLPRLPADLDELGTVKAADF